MEIKIENQKLAPAINLLYKLNLKGMKSIYRTRFQKLLRAKLEAFVEDEKELAKSYCNLDEKGEAKIIDGNRFDVKEGMAPAFAEERLKLNKEARVIDGGDNQTMLQSVKKSLAESTEDWQGADADTYEYLFTVFEKVADPAKGGEKK